MSAHHDEQQDIENAKHLWNKGGKWVFAALVAAALGYLGHVIYQNHQQNQKETAAALAAKVKDGASPELTQLQQEFAQSMGAAQAMMQTAAQAFHTGKLDDAATAYQWVLTNQKAPLLQAAAANNLANVYLQQKKYDDALQVLATPVEAAFQPLLEETKGDVYVAQGKNKEATTAYQSALDKLPDNAPNRELLQLKLGQL